MNAGEPLLSPLAFLTSGSWYTKNVRREIPLLWNALGYLTPIQQKRLAQTGGVTKNWLGPPNEQRAYVMSSETKKKIEENQARHENAIVG